jgi:aspartyl-tRNA(Asn)/glutamyl-tRNA(Gln) amidotransferase subunit A
MNSKDICFASIEELQKWYAEGSLSPVETVEALLERIRDVDKKVNSYITVMEETARREAREAEKELKEGSLKPLLGIPIGLKDAIDVEGVRTTRGSKIFAGTVAERNARIVDNLRGAGAMLTGKLNMDEFQFGLTTDCSHFGPTHNPWNLDRISGGSSGGSAASVAAGLCLGSIGTDAGGSVRVPASMCGVVGLKPTFGIVNSNGISPFSWSTTHVGPLARTVKDAQAIFEVLIDDSIIQQPILVESRRRASQMEGLKGLKVGVLEDYYRSVTDERVTSLFLDALRTMEDLCAEVTNVSIPVMEFSRLAGSVIIGSEAASVYLEELRTKKEDMVKEVRTRLMVGAALSALDYITAQKISRRLREAILNTLKSIDILALPTTPLTAPPIRSEFVEINGKEVRAYNMLARFTTVFSLVGVPALSVPCGFTDENLPAGLELVGRPLQEYTLFKAGEEYERKTGFRRRLKELF